MDIQRAVAKAKIGIMTHKHTTFLSTLCCSLDTTIGGCETAATDGTRLYINKDFFLGLSQEERIFILAHETLHVAYLHALRGHGLDHELFNMAADYIINNELIEYGFHMPNIGLQDSKYKGMSTEQVYNLLKDQPKLPQNPLKDLIQNDSNEDTSTKESEIQSKIIKAALTAEISNDTASIPVSIKRYLDTLRKPKVNWQQVLRQLLTEHTKSDYSWRRPNRRLLPMYLPSLYGEALARLDFAIDTSGSITESAFAQLMSELHSVIKTFNPKELGVYQFDHSLCGNDIVKSLQDFKAIKLKGGGGTNPQVAIDEYSKHKAKVLVILTDGYFYTHLVTDPKRPVIWVVYDNPEFKAPFGNTIHFNLE